MKKFKMLMLIAVVSLIGMPAVSALSISAYGAVTDYTPNGAGKATYGDAIEGITDGKVTTFDIKDKDLIVIDENKGEEERPVDDATWFGIAIAKPTADAELSSACWVRAGETTCKEEADAEADGKDDTYTLWVPFQSQELKDAIARTGEGAVVSKMVQLRWGGNDDTENVQTVYINLHTDSVTLTIDDTPGEAEKILADAKFDEEDEQAAIEEYEATHQDAPVVDSEESENQEEQKPEKNADTSDMNLTLLLSVLAASTLGLGYTVKKRFN